MQQHGDCLGLAVTMTGWCNLPAPTQVYEVVSGKAVAGSGREVPGAVGRPKKRGAPGQPLVARPPAPAPAAGPKPQRQVWRGGGVSLCSVFGMCCCAWGPSLLLTAA